MLQKILKIAAKSWVDTLVRKYRHDPVVMTKKCIVFIDTTRGMRALALALALAQYEQIVTKCGVGRCTPSISFMK